MLSAPIGLNRNERLARASGIACPGWKADHEKAHDGRTASASTALRSDRDVVLGAGVGFALGKSNLVIDARYYLGLANMIDTSSLGDLATSEDWVKSRAIVIMLGLLF